MMKKIYWTVFISVVIIIALGVLYYAGWGFYSNLSVILMNSKYNEADQMPFFYLLYNIASLLVCITCLFFCIREYFKLWKLSPKELKEQEENRLIKAEMEQKKEKERMLLEIERKKQEIKELENELKQ